MTEKNGFDPMEIEGRLTINHLLCANLVDDASRPRAAGTQSAIQLLLGYGLLAENTLKQLF